MTGINDGGPAFPRSLDPYPNLQDVRRADQASGTGMTLRDWFAGQVLPAIYTDAEHEQTWRRTDGNDSFAVMTARVAYQMADAMLAERAKEPG